MIDETYKAAVVNVEIIFDAVKHLLSDRDRSIMMFNMFILKLQPQYWDSREEGPPKFMPDSG